MAVMLGEIKIEHKSCIFAELSDHSGVKHGTALAWEHLG